MNGRLLIITLLVMLVIGGLFVGLFARPIQQALTVPEPRPAIPTMTVQPSVKAQVTPAMPSQMPANLIAQDTFQRKNQTLWGMASDTSRWDGDANNPIDQTIFSIVNQTGQIANGQGAFNALLGPATTNADVTLSGQINAFAGDVNLGVVLRWQDANNWYKALIDGTRLRLIRDFQGTTAMLGSFPFDAQGGMLYNLRFRTLGAMLFVKVWPAGITEPTTWMIATTDNTLRTGQSGIRVVVDGGSVVAIKSFQVTTDSM